MTRKSRRDALLARFRAGSLTRIADVRAMLDAPAPLSAALLSELHAPLHTLKGEARMLGLTSLAALVHQLEDRLGEYSAEPVTLARVRRATVVIEAMLRAQLIENSEAEQSLARGLALLAGELDDSPSHALDGDGAGGSPAHDKKSGPPRIIHESNFSLVRAELVDELCERLEVLRVSFGQALLGGRSSYGRETREAVIRGDTTLASSDASPDLTRARSGQFDQIRHELAELAELAWTLRLVPVEPALDALSEHAQATAEQLGKNLRVRIDAGGAQLERSLLEHLQEPIMHLINNAVDHGVEAAAAREQAGKPSEAKLEITARSIGPEVEFRVSDDGGGINLDEVRARAVTRGLLDESMARSASDEQLLPLLFESGFSTSTTVSELSGRGVGLDAVRRAIEGLGGEVFVRSNRGRGTTFSIRVPLTISRETVVVIELGNTLWGLPSRRVGPVVALPGGDAEPTVVVEGDHVPLLSLAGLLGSEAGEGARVGICCSHGGRRYALSSPPVLGEFDLFRRPLGPLLASVSPASASAVMDDGRLVLLLDPAALLTDRGRQTRTALRGAPSASPSRPRVLVVDDSPIVRELLVELLTGAKLDVLTAGDGREALDVLARNKVQLVVSDVEMPNVDGFELLRRIRERDRELPVIMVTTRGSVADRERASSLGADAYLVKSDFRDQNMLEAVARFVEISR